MTDTEHDDSTRQEYAEPVAPSPRGTPTWLVVLAVFGAFILLTVLILDRVQLGNKVLTAPGGTIDIEPIVSVSGVETYPSDAEIRLVTVRSNLEPSVLELIGAWFDDSIRIQDREAVLGERSVEENRTIGQQQMAQSLDVASRVALERLGYDVITEAGALIVQVAADTPAADVLSAGDVIVAVAGQEVLTSTQLVAAVQAMAPGDLFPFTVLELDGSTHDETVVLAEREGSAFLGVSISTFVDMKELPFDVQFDLERIGGPSAGLALTLTVLDVLTEGELTGGLDLVTTGTIDPLGNIGPIGGIEQKSHAVLREGADLFIVPSSDLQAALDVIGDRIDVVGVDTLDQALDALEERGGDTSAVARMALEE